MADFKVALETLGKRGVLTQAAYERLRATLGDGRLGDIDDLGFVEATVEADDFEDALRVTWNAMAAAGADDHFVFAEHPDIPEHWRRAEGGGPPSGAVG
jgi:hypothetical protein